MAKFMLILNHRPGRYDDLSPEENWAIIKDYIAWVERQAGAGVYLGGEKLGGEGGRTVSRPSGDLEVHDAPFAELPEVLGGYMIIQAEDYDHAVALSADHPHLVHNEALVIRQIDEVE